MIARFVRVPLRVALLAAIGVFLVALNTFVFTIASALFLTNEGAARLPVTYVVMGIVSVPLYAWFSRIVDRHRRETILHGSMFIAAAMFIAVWAMAKQATPWWLHQIMFITAYFQWNVHLSILLPSLFSDHLNAIEYKRFTFVLATAQGVGGIAGGAAAGFGARYFKSFDLLLGSTLFCLVVAMLVELLKRTQTLSRLEAGDAPGGGFLQDVRFFPKLARRSPIILYLAGSTFFYIVLYSFAEFLYCSVYAQAFRDDQKLTEFLGTMRVVGDLLQLLLLYLATRSLLDRVGVPRLTVVYPWTTTISFASFLLSMGLPTAVAVHLNAGPIETALNQPVHNLNYNAVPHRHLGRVRAICDGIAYAVGLGFAGAALSLAQRVLDTRGIALVATLLSALFILVRHRMAINYTRSLLVLLRMRAIDLSAVDDQLRTLPDHHAVHIRPLLKSRSDQDQRLGLELTARLRDPRVLSAELLTLAAANSTLVRSTVASVLRRYAADFATLDVWLRSDDPRMRRQGALLAPGRFLSDPDELTAELAAFMHAEGGLVDHPENLAFLIPALQQPGDLELLCRLWFSVRRCAHEIRSVYLRHVEKVSRLVDGPLPCGAKWSEIVREVLSDPHEECLEAALRFAQRLHDPALCSILAEHLRHPTETVRQAAVDALAGLGDPGVGEARKLLESPVADHVDAAIEVIAGSRVAQATEILSTYMRPYLLHFNDTWKWFGVIPDGTPLQIAIEDFHHRLLARILRILSKLGDARTLALVQIGLKSSDTRARAEAIEILSTMAHREFIQSMTPLLHARLEEHRARSVGTDEQMAFILLEARRSPDIWIRRVAAADQEERHTMEQLFFLKKVTPFQDLSLDEVATIHEHLEQDQYFADEEIFQEGANASDLFIVVEGEVAIMKNGRELARLSAGAYFGEMALFDDLPRSATAVATVDCKLLRLGRERFMSLMRQRPHISMEMCRVLSRHLRATSARVARRSTMPPAMSTSRHA